jgi:glycerol uptake facilitator-like aquaporin
MSLLGNFIGELIATFFFIAVILLTASKVYGAFSIGLALTIGILFASKLSLGALNPAVAVALWAKKAINLPTMIVYILAELIGGLLAVVWWNYAGGSALPP